MALWLDPRVIVKNPFRLGLILLTAACGNDATGPGPRKVSLAASTGNGQFGLANAALAEPFQVIVTDPDTRQPVENITVEWKVVQGAGASVSPVTSVTGRNGVATTVARLGPANGPYVFEASAANQVGTAARFEARAVLPPVILTLSASTVNGGDTITVTGSNFSTNPDENIVLFGGMRGRVTSATATQLRVVVPICLPTRSVSVTAALGAVSSDPLTISVRGAIATPLLMSRGEVRRFVEPADLQCQRLTLQSGSLFLVIPQNYSEVVGSQTFFDLIGITGQGGIVLNAGNHQTGSSDFASDWELRLRTRERAFSGGVTAPGLPASFRPRPPEIGDRRTFKVYDKNEKFVNATAEVKYISRNAIIYQDVNAPANGFTDADFQAIGTTFDAPTYETNVAVFGQPSDIDSNGRIIILLTPLVNELTPKNSAGFVAGFFFGCDLQTKTECSGTNLSEVFYLFVPDPTGKFGDPRSRSFVLNGVSPVLAHEFQHMINFAARKSLDALWLSEALAHMAEDIVGEVYANRGELQTAAQFRAQNYARATLYLRDSTATSMLAEELPGTLELRGAGWLMLKYLTGHYGGHALLRRLTQSTQNSVQNITTQTGQPWSKLMSDWAVALYADDAPELSGAVLLPEHTFSNLNLRTTLTSGGAYPLRTPLFGAQDFIFRGSMRASTQRHVLVEVTSKGVNLALTGQRGGAPATGAALQATVLRIR